MTKSPLYSHPAVRAALVAAALTLLCQAEAQAYCGDDWLSISRLPDGDAIELRATNRHDFPMTYAVMIERRESPGVPLRTVSDTLLGKQSRRVAVLPAQADSGDISCTWTIGSRHAAHDDDHVYRLPWADGRSFRVLQGFESDWSHRGAEQFAIDFEMPVGTPVHAARAGIVAKTEADSDTGCWDETCDRFANYIVLLHSDGTTGEYYHLQRSGVLVGVGERVEAGQIIGLSGNTGRSAKPHLHFAVYRATSRAQSQSIPIRLLTGTGIVYRPRNGHYYAAISGQISGD